MKCITPYRRVINGINTDLPCGKCYPCKQRRISDWSTRLHFEELYSQSAHFVTLTYNHENLKFFHSRRFASLCKRDLQLFFKRVRKRDKRSPEMCRRYPIKFLAAGEYGTKNKRPHYHAIIFNTTQECIIDSWTIAGEPLGSVYFGQVTGASIAYTVGYIAGNEANRGHVSRYKLQPQFLTFSKKLGAAYLRPAMVDYHCSPLQVEHKCYVMVDGRKCHMPRYYRDRLYSASNWLKVKQHMQEISDDSCTYDISVLNLYSDEKLKQKRKDNLLLSF